MKCGIPKHPAIVITRPRPKGADKCCDGTVRHERWCITSDPAVQYAYGAVFEPEKLTLMDRLVLHALGVSWDKNPCQGTCPAT
jgi:hypothetical protein